MGVKLVSVSGGSVEINPPATASNFTATMPAGTGNVVVNGVNGALVSGTAVASTSGTSIDFTGIPSWAKRVTVMFQGVSTSGTSSILLQLGAGSVTTSGYLGSCAQGPTLTGTQFTTGIGVIQSSTAAVVHGSIGFVNLNGNGWVASGVLSRSDAGVAIYTAGSISLSGTLDRIRITTVNGTDTFDAGSINILYE